MDVGFSSIKYFETVFSARCSGVEAADWTVDWEIWVRFPVYPYLMWDL